MIKTRYIVKGDYDNRRLLKGEQLYISKDKKYLMNYRTEFICDINSSWFGEYIEVKEENIIEFPKVYKHFKHELYGENRPNNYLYCTMFKSKPIEELKTNFTEIMSIWHTELEEEINLYLVNNNWVHFKNKCKDELVIYKDLYNGNNGNLYKGLRVYGRPYSMFASEVDYTKYPQIKQKYRFEELY